MRIIQSESPRPLNVLAIGSNGLVAAASDTFDVPSDVEVWEIASARRCLLHRAPEHNAAGAIVFTPDGRYLLLGEPGLKLAVVDPTSDALVTRVQTALSRPRFALSADGTHLIVASNWNQCGAVECIAVGPGPTFRQLWVEGPPHEFLWFDAVALAPDAKWAAVVERTAHGGPGGRPALSLSVRDADTGTARFTLRLDPASPVHQLAFTTDGSRVLVRTDGNRVQLFSATVGAAAGELAHRGRPFVTGMAVHPRGPVACARTDGTVTFWDTDTRQPIRTLDWKAGRLASVAFSSDGALAAAGTEDGKIVVWDVDL
jgi:WD40 repeat protein